VSISTTPWCRRFWSSKKKGRKARTEASEYTDSRYVCSLKEVMEQLVEGELSVDAYPSVLPMPTRSAHTLIYIEREMDAQVIERHCLIPTRRWPR
jgi:hypothetical protein